MHDLARMALAILVVYLLGVISGVAFAVLLGI